MGGATAGVSLNFSDSATIMGIRFECPNGHKLNVKAQLAGKRGICPRCDSRFIVPAADGGRVPPADDQTAASFPDAQDSAEPPVEQEAVDQPVEQVAVDQDTAEAPSVHIEGEPIIDVSILPAKPHRSSHRSRQERARRLTLIFSAVIFALTIALVLVLLQ